MHFVRSCLQVYQHRGSPVLRWSRLSVLLLAAMLLSACTLFGGEETPTPVVEVPIYEPDSGETTPGPDAANGEVAGAPSTADNATAQGEDAAASDATGTAAASPESVAPGARVARAQGALAPYSGNVVAENQVGVAVEVIGRVLRLTVEVGDRVQAGEVLLELDKVSLEARRAQALAALEAAQAQLDLLMEEPAESDLDAARAAIAAAEAAYQRALEGPTEEDLRAAEAQLRQAEAAVSQAQSAYDLVKDFPNIGALPQSLQLQQATLQLEAAQAQYDKLVKGSTADVIAAAYAQVSQSRAALAALEQGPKDGQIRAAEAQVRQAETALYLAQIELDKATVRAPIDGVLVEVDTAVGAQASPGASIFQIQSNEVKVEIAVEESRLSQIHVGQPARIRVNAYPDRTFEGEIAIIAPVLDPSTRTVQVTIRPTGDVTDLRPGMFATVELLDASEPAAVN